MHFYAPLQPATPSRLGDLSLRSHEVALELVGSTIDHHAQAALAHEKATGSLPFSAQECITRLQNGIDAFKSHVSNPDNYLPGARENITARYRHADTKSLGKTIEERVAARLGAFERRGFAIDVDGTLTTDPAGYLETVLPGSQTAERLLKQLGREEFVKVFSLTWSSILKETPDLFTNGARQTDVVIRDGVEDFFTHVHEEKSEVQIVSANHWPFVSGVLGKIQTLKDARVWAVDHDSAVSTEKSYVVDHIAKTDTQTALIYIGDGHSDLSVVNAGPFQTSDVIACYFALEGGTFARELKTKKLPFFTYKSFYDISEKLAEIDALANSETIAA